MTDRVRKGRCAGCGFTKASIKAVNAHIATCSDYANLYQSAKERCLGAVEEYDRWFAEQHDIERRADAKADLKSRLSTESDRKLAYARERFSSAGGRSGRIGAGHRVPPPPGAVLKIPKGHTSALSQFLATRPEELDT